MLHQDLSSLTSSLKLVKCVECNKHGHASCFGYKDGHASSEHRCYSCRPGCAPDKLGDIAYLRLGLALVWDHGIYSRIWLSKTLGMYIQCYLVLTLMR